MVGHNAGMHAVSIAIVCHLSLDERSNWGGYSTHRACHSFTFCYLNKLFYFLYAFDVNEQNFVMEKTVHGSDQ